MTGSRLVSRAPTGLLVLLAACSGRPADPQRAPRSASEDSAFTQLQARGELAMGVDQYTSAHRFEPLADGGSISLVRNPDDSAGVAQIRSHMQAIAKSFGRGDFAVPGFVHGREVPGTRGMDAYRSNISYSVDTLPGGARLRLKTAEPAAVTAIHEFLAFQRHDHRAGSGPAH